MLRPSDHVRALTVRISDPAPGAEKFLRGFAAAAWPSLARLSPFARRVALGGAELSRRAGGGPRGGRVRPGKRSRARGVEARLAGPARCRPRPGDCHRVEFVGPIDEP